MANPKSNEPAVIAKFDRYGELIELTNAVTGEPFLNDDDVPPYYFVDANGGSANLREPGEGQRRLTFIMQSVDQGDLLERRCCFGICPWY